MVSHSSYVLVFCLILEKACLKRQRITSKPVQIGLARSINWKIIYEILKNPFCVSAQTCTLREAIEKLYNE